MPLTNNSNSGYCNNKAAVSTPKTVEAANEAYNADHLQVLNEANVECRKQEHKKKTKTKTQKQQQQKYVEEAIDAVVRAFKWCTDMSAMSCRRMRATDRIRRMSTDRPTDVGIKKRNVWRCAVGLHGCTN